MGPVGQMPGMRGGLFDPRLRTGADVAAFGHDAVCDFDSGAGAAGGLPRAWRQADAGARAESQGRFTLLCERFAVAVLLASASVSQACELLGIGWETAHEMMGRAVKRGCERRPPEAMKHLGMDEKISEEQRSEFSALKDLHLKVARAWAAKELFSKFWDYQEEGWARRFFKDWFGWGSRSRRKPLVEVAHMLKRHLENLVTYLKHPITNAGTEG